MTVYSDTLSGSLQGHNIVGWKYVPYFLAQSPMPKILRDSELQSFLELNFANLKRKN